MNDRIRDDAGSIHHDASHFYELVATLPRDRSPVTGENHVGEKRAERICWKLPVQLGKARGTTRDISASGVFFETDATCPLLSHWMPFEVELDTPNGKILLKYLGEIVRIEPRNEKVGVAVRIIESSVEAIHLA